MNVWVYIVLGGNGRIVVGRTRVLKKGPDASESVFYIQY